jgi:hypothetical protein
MRPVFVVPLPLGAVLVGLMLGWTIGLAVAAVGLVAIGIGMLFWRCLDVWRARRRNKELFGPIHRH